MKSGRTHLMDATPVTLGQEFGGYAAQVELGVERLESTLPRVGRAAARRHGGRHRHQHPARLRRTRRSTAAPTTRACRCTEARDHFEAQGARDALVELSGQLRTIAVSLYKICNDLRWMGSGPRAGLARSTCPTCSPGRRSCPARSTRSSPRRLCMVCAQVIGNDAAVAFAGASGNFELNVMLPVIARNVLESIRLLANVSRLLADRCVDGIDGQRGALPRVRRVVAVDRHAAEPLHRLRGRGRRSPSRPSPSARRSARSCIEHGLRRAGRAHRGAARRGARRPAP